MRVPPDGAPNRTSATPANAGRPSRRRRGLHPFAVEHGGEREHEERSRDPIISTLAMRVRVAAVKNTMMLAANTTPSGPIVRTIAQFSRRPLRYSRICQAPAVSSMRQNATTGSGRADLADER